jgi:hypothetical protein
MVLPRMRSLRRSTTWRVALGSALAIVSVGCQVEYAGMTLPSGRYMHDDVQYFPSGPDFPWANTQAATQRVRMRAMGIEPGAGIGTAPVPPGYLDPTQNLFGQGGRPANVNVQPQVMPPGVLPPQPVPGGAQPVPGVPVPGAPQPPAPQPPPPGEVPPPGPQ